MSGFVMIDFKYAVYPVLQFIFYCGLISSIVRPDYNVMVALVLMVALKQGTLENFDRMIQVLFVSSAVDVAWLTVVGSAGRWLYSPFLNDVCYSFAVINVLAKMFLLMFCIIVIRNWREGSEEYFQKLNSEPIEIEVVHAGH